jgi:hypothetical protein
VTNRTERRALQIVVAIACLSPLGFGLLGMIHGGGAFGGIASIDADSHFRYLSGLFFGIGVMAISCVPRIERHRERFGWVVLFVVIGGLARLYGFASHGVPEGSHFYAVFMELVVTPLLGLWQRRLSTQSQSSRGFGRGR